MSDRPDIKKKEIRIQKPAQSLTAFQRKVAAGTIDKAPGLLKNLLFACLGVLVVVIVAVSWNFWQRHKITQHETALSALLMGAEGNRAAPGPPSDKEARMRDALPRLEALAKAAPGASKAVTNGILSAWKLELGVEGVALPGPTDPWSRLRLASRHIALGQAKEALEMASPLHGRARPDQAWSQTYWTTLMQIRQLENDRAQALKDYAEYRRLFKSQESTGELDKLLQMI